MTAVSIALAIGTVWLMWTALVLIVLGAAFSVYKVYSSGVPSSRGTGVPAT